jgi:hypothetical protein
MNYQVTICNLPFKQAQALYRTMVDLQDSEDFQGVAGMTWSGIIPSRDKGAHRSITIEPMPGEND